MTRALPAFCLLAALLGGCPPTDPGDGDGPGFEALTPPPGLVPERPSEQAGVQVRGVRISLYSIEVPAGQASRSEEIWSYLDEERLGIATSLTLGLNGVRVGMGRREDWLDVASVLRRLTGRSLSAGQVSLLPGQVTRIRLVRDAPGRGLFIYRPDRTLVGRDYPGGDYILAVGVTLNEEDLSEVVLTAAPALELPASAPRPVVREGQVGWEAGPQAVSFDEMLFQVRVPSNDFMVLGPGAESRRSTSVGDALLIHDRKGLPFETVLVLVPEVFSTPVQSPRMDPGS